MRAFRENPKAFSLNIAKSAAPALSSVIVPQLASMPRALNGFPLHVTHLLITLTVAFATTANTMEKSMPPIKVYNALRSVGLKIGAHRFIPDLRGAEVAHDSRRMNVGHVFTVPAALPDADATPSRTFTLAIPIGLPASAVGAERDGVIPVCALRDGDLEIVLAGANDAQHAGVVITAITDLTVDVRLEPLHQLRVPTAWGVRRAEAGDVKDLLLNPSGFMYYLDLFDPRQETPAIAPAVYGPIEIAIGQAELKRQEVRQLANLHELEVARHLAGAGYAPVSTTAPEYLPIARSYWNDLVTRQPRGNVKVSLPDKVGLTTWSAYYRERGVMSREYQVEMLTRIGVPADIDPAKVRAESRAAKKRAPAWLVPHLDLSLTWEGMPYPAIAE